MQPAAVEAASPWCTSFLPGGGARAAFRRVLVDPYASGKAAVRIDVRDYFNSIGVIHPLATLPETFATGAMGALLRSSLLDARVRGGGVMAGRPIAPMLATLYLRDLDHEIAATSATYARSSDDFLALAAPENLPEIETLLRARLVERGLRVNEKKSTSAAPREPWDFLGFRYARGTIAAAPNTERKLKAKTTRLARRLPRRREQQRAPNSGTVCALSVARTAGCTAYRSSEPTSRGRRGSSRCSTTRAGSNASITTCSARSVTPRRGVGRRARAAGCRTQR
jgi:hypothetical protein